MTPLREKAEHTLDTKCSKVFFDLPLRIMKNKTKINKWKKNKNKWDLTPLKSTGTAEETINITKRQTP